jgi:DNA-binding NtrC family response regulator
VVRIIKGHNGFKWGLGVEFFDVPPRELAMLGEIKRRARFSLPRVLLLSRDDALCDLVEARLPDDRYDVVRVKKIGDLKAALEKEKATLLVTDIDCEEGILKRIRKASGDAAVVVISRKVTPELKAMAGSYGIYGCLEKPLDSDKFMGAVSQEIQAYRLAAFVNSLFSMKLQPCRA